MQKKESYYCSTKITMSRNNKETKQNLKALDKQNDQDDIFKKMLEFRFDQPLTDKFVFEEDDDLGHLNEEDAMCKVYSEYFTEETSAGSNNKIILGTKKISRKSKDKETDHAHTEETINGKQNRNKRKKCHVDNAEPSDIINIHINKTSHLSLNKMVSIPLENVKDFSPENNLSISEEFLSNLPSIKLPTEEQVVTQKNINSDDNTENRNIFNSTQSNDSEINKNTKADTVMKIKVPDNTGYICNLEKYPMKPTDAIKELDFRSKCDTIPALNSTNYTEREKLDSVAIGEIKQKYKSFPRTKVTSRRDIKKFPGKMAAMKKSMDKTTMSIESSSLGTIEEIINDIPNAPSKPDVLKNNLTNSTINVPTNKTEDLSKNLKYQKILNDIYYEVQHSTRPESNVKENIGVTTTKPTTEENLLYQDNFYDPRYEALKTVAENLLAVFPCLNLYMLLKHNTQAQNKEAFARAQRNFYKAKIQSFGLSYSTVVSFILPYKNNPQCMDAFYALVMKISREKKMQDVLPINLQTLCSEMIGWTENKKMQMQNFNNDYYSDVQIVEASNKNIPVQNQQLTQLLAGPPNTSFSNAGNINPSAKHPKTKAHAASLRFAAGPPGREIQISYDANLHHPLSSPNVQPNQKTTSQMPYGNQWTSPVLTPPNVTITASSNQAPWLAHTPSHHINSSAPMVPTHPPQNMPLPTQTYPQAFESFCSSREPLRPPPPSYEQTQREPQIYHQKQQFEDSIYNVRPSVIQERSSVSRDSGFMSPVGDNSALEQLDGFVNDLPADEESLTPMITHVTSMNPKATYTPYSKCHVCGINTNLRCIGCNRIYYCGSQCQGFDWGTHKRTCHK